MIGQAGPHGRYLILAQDLDFGRIDAWRLDDMHDVAGGDAIANGTFEAGMQEPVRVPDCASGEPSCQQAPVPHLDLIRTQRLHHDGAQMRGDLALGELLVSLARLR
jgi:hypothetical protein